MGEEIKKWNRFEFATRNIPFHDQKPCFPDPRPPAG